MKKLILSFVLAIGMITSGFAQQEGDQTFGFSFGYNTSTSTTMISMGSESAKETTPGNKIFAVSAEYGKFISDNIRVGVGLAYDVTSQEGSEDSTDTLIIAPNLAYYIPIADNLYYTPAVTVGYASANYNSSDDGLVYSENFSGYVAGISLLAFEYRYSEKIAINLNLGSFEYMSLSYDLEDDAKITINAKAFDILSNVSAGFSLYF